MTAIIELITQQPFLGAQGADPQDQTALVVVAAGLFDGPDEGLRQLAHVCFFWAWIRRKLNSTAKCTRSIPPRTLDLKSHIHGMKICTGVADPHRDPHPTIMPCPGQHKRDRLGEGG